MERKGWFAGQGSIHITSTAAPASLPDSRACSIARWSTTAARAVLISFAPSFILANQLSFTMPVVSLVTGKWMDRMSAAPSVSSRDENFAPASSTARGSQ